MDKVTMSKEEAVKFALEYLAHRRDNYTKVPKRLAPDLETLRVVQEVLERAWDCAVDYIVNDIIPFIYGQSLD